MSVSTGNLRLHPADPQIIGTPNGVRMTGGDVDLSFVPDAPPLRRRTEREDAPALKRRLKREKRARNHAARRARMKAATIDA